MQRFLAVGYLLCSAVASFAQAALPHFSISRDLEITQISPHVYVHVSFAAMPGWGRVASNGLIYAVNGEALLLDTPTTDSLTRQLVIWVSDSLKARIVGFVPNHWHSDCMGGLAYLHSVGIASYANEKTIAIARARNLPVPRHGFVDSLILRVGGQSILCRYFGPAHTDDNIVAWVPSEKILFAGCMVKDLSTRNLGNTADANVKEYPKTVARVITAFPSAAFVIPGHGAFGGLELLRHTLDLAGKPAKGKS